MVKVYSVEAALEEVELVGGITSKEQGEKRSCHQSQVAPRKLTDNFQVGLNPSNSSGWRSFDDPHLPTHQPNKANPGRSPQRIGLVHPARFWR